MNLKKQLKKLDIYDLKFICNEVGIKYNKKSSKQIIIRELLKPINKKHKYAMKNKAFLLTRKGFNEYKRLNQKYKQRGLNKQEEKELELFDYLLSEYNEGYNDGEYNLMVETDKNEKVTLEKFYEDSEGLYMGSADEINEGYEYFIGQGYLKWQSEKKKKKKE